MKEAGAREGIVNFVMYSKALANQCSRIKLHLDKRTLPTKLETHDSLRSDLNLIIHESANIRRYIVPRVLHTVAHARAAHGLGGCWPTAP